MSAPGLGPGARIANRGQTRLRWMPRLFLDANVLFLRRPRQPGSAATGTRPEGVDPLISAVQTLYVHDRACEVPSWSEGAFVSLEDLDDRGRSIALGIAEDFLAVI